jgi:16S rRNA (adenine1518-N6/adenine1519-N6)-dimethyltransferase
VPAHFYPKKRFGQHFMTDGSDLRFIVDALGLAAGEHVLEIGPGPGALTGALLDKGLRVTAVEKDRSLAARLGARFPGRPLEVVCADILGFVPKRDTAPRERLVVVGNIPYNITSPILSWLVDQRPFIRRAVLTVQWEVARRLAGRPGHEAWGAVSVSLQAYAEVALLKRVPRGHFDPAPRVDSAVVRLDFLPEPRFEAAHRELFHEIVARAFQKRRKTLFNALEDARRGRGKERLLRALAEARIDPKRRPETLGVSEWVLLARCLSK